MSFGESIGIVIRENPSYAFGYAVGVAIGFWIIKI
tara:strand:- start:59892 stop:59996 length:105 start_codon:yes stop_codon:yes gene_type:complete